MGKYRKLDIILTEDQRSSLEMIVRRGMGSAMEIRRANVILMVDGSLGKGMKDVDVAKALGITPQAVHNIKARFIDSTAGHGEEAAGKAGDAVKRKERNTPPVPPKCTGDVEARIIALACSEPPGREIEMDVEASFRKVRGAEDNRLHIPYAGGKDTKKNEYKPHLKKMWCIPPGQNAAFVAAMEDVLELYSRPYDPEFPLVCMDEQPIELHEDAHPAIEMSESNHTRKVDHEYVRKGTCCAFMFNEPLGGWRRVTVNRTRKRDDWALQIKRLVDEDYPDAKRIILVCDNLNTHNAASLYQAFSPEEARRIWERIELHHTPKHGSWLDMAEIELSAFTSQCLNRNIDSMEKLQEEATAWYVDRNRRQKGIDWQFSVDDARSKLKRLYPVVELEN